jgi:hypothetical protein
MPIDFVDTTQKEIEDILAINIHATLHMTLMIMPGMIQWGQHVADCSSPHVLIYSIQEVQADLEHGLVCGFCLTYACHLLQSPDQRCSSGCTQVRSWQWPENTTLWLNT